MAAVARNVTFPARQCNVNGEHRSFALLRPIVDTTAQGKLRALILDASAEWEAQAAVASCLFRPGRPTLVGRSGLDRSTAG